ncbi:hypothetical protein CUR178_04408 [Leishmania enriettii]|uniref:RING-type domain-containing protein n=1 Tax=Leishmania enriettii TaxID=5663 RepID=A0A836HDW5_LEIEN|nr:hypothetical protein CUR178_04408 [Leishmania enriettii]
MPALATASSSSSESRTPRMDAGTLCMKCHQSAIEFETNSCHHPCFCRPCAMKCASGGKCKTCGQFYAGLTHLRR